jgi:hypothetical protein
MRIRTPLHLAIIALLTGAMLITAACGFGDDDSDNTGEVANERNQPYTGSPTALAERGEDTEEIKLAIEDGKFGEDEIELQEQHPSVIIVTNDDDTEYSLEIENLVANTAIPAGTTTNVGFTTPESGTYTATLTRTGSTDALDTMTVQVVSPGNVPD